jgi:hypothetical protein
MYGNSVYKSKIPSMVSGWLDYFNNEQLISLV